MNKFTSQCPFHAPLPTLEKKLPKTDIFQFLTNPTIQELGTQRSLYRIPYIGNSLGDMYGYILGTNISSLENLDAKDALSYIQQDVHERKNPNTLEAVCPFENAFFKSNGYGYKIYTVTQDNLKALLLQSVKDYQSFTTTIQNTKDSLLCVILDGVQESDLAYLERELILMKNNIYSKDGFMGGFVAGKTLAGAARVSHVGGEQDPQLLEKGPFEKNGKPMVMTRHAHYGSKSLLNKNLIKDEQTEYSRKIAINFGDYGSYRNPVQILNSIHMHKSSDKLSQEQFQYLCQNLANLYHDFFFAGQQGDTHIQSGKISIDKQKLTTYLQDKEQSADKIMNYFYEQYLCLLSDVDQTYIYQMLQQNTVQGLSVIGKLINDYEQEYYNLIKLLQLFSDGASIDTFEAHMQIFFGKFNKISLS